MKYLKHLEQRDWDSIDDKLVDRQWAAYRKQLEKLRARLPQKAWRYFWHGFAETSIHDATLISFSVGDGLKQTSRRPDTNALKITAEFLNQNGKHRFIFNYSKIKKFSFNFDATLGAHFIDLKSHKYFLDRSHYLQANHLDLVLGDELTAVDKTYLRHELIFASGARIAIEAARLIFDRKRA